MPTVFVHGVADTYRLWDDVRSHLGDVDTVALALPGFGAPLPQGFIASKERYVDWIIGELATFGAPVDLVGHDWGCMFALRVASLRPDLVRTVVVGNGPISKNYEWHQLAKTWQTPGDGEQFMRQLDAHSLAEMLQSLGVPADAARATSERVDDRMKSCILKLYRSADHVGDEWESGISNIQCPATIFWGKSDTECPIRFAYEMAEHLPNARVVEFECGHWVPLQLPIDLSTLLQEHLDSQTPQ